MKGLLEAIKQGNEAEVARLLDGDPALLAKNVDQWGATPLTVAAEHGQLGVVRVLIRRGADTEAGRFGTALDLAASKGHKEIVAFLLSNGAQAHGKGYDYKTPLMTACQKGHLGVVRLLAQHQGAQALQEKDDWGGSTVLHWAARGGHEEVASFLLGQGAQGTSRDTFGQTPFLVACWGGQLGMVRFLVQHMGKEVLNEDADMDQRSALHLAATEGHEDVVAFLLGQGADATKRDNRGWTPFRTACRMGRVRVVQLLVQHMGLEVLQEVYERGWTALHDTAGTVGSLIDDGSECPDPADVVAFLLEQGLDANRPGVKGRTPLMLACKRTQCGFERLKTVQVLLQHMEGEALQQRDVNGMTALHLAVCDEFSELGVIRAVLLAGVDPTSTDNRGATPRELAEHEDERYIELDWWEEELERRHVLYRATSLHRAYATQRAQPTAQASPYLEARVATGQALPVVEVLLRQSQQEWAQVGGSPNWNAWYEEEFAQGVQVEEEEMHAVVEYVLQTLDEALLTELLEGFHA